MRDFFSNLYRNTYNLQVYVVCLRATNGASQEESIQQLLLLKKKTKL